MEKGKKKYEYKSLSYKVKPMGGLVFEVIEISTVEGERLNAYESEPDKKYKKSVFSGNISECYSFLKLKEGKYM